MYGNMYNRGAAPMQGGGKPAQAGGGAIVDRRAVGSGVRVSVPRNANALSDVAASSLDYGRVPAAAGGAGRGGLVLAALNQYQVGWTVMVRVFAKSAPREYSNERGQGRIASVTLIDGSGSMKAIMFGESIERWLNALEVGKSYLISGASVRPSRQSPYEVSPLGHDLIVSSETQFTPVTDGSDRGLPQHSLDLVPFTSLREMLERQKAEAQGAGAAGAPQGYLVDIIGIVVDSQPMQEIMSKKQQPLFKRDVTLLDTTGSTVKVTIWGNKFEVDDRMLAAPVLPQGRGSPQINVLSVSGARISDFSGCSLSTSFSSILFQNPNWNETNKLRQWFAGPGRKLFEEASFQALSSAKLDTSGWIESHALSTCSDMAALKNQYQMDQQPLTQAITLKIQVRLTYVKKPDDQKPVWYLSCPNELCRGKKVQPSDGDDYMCDKCNSVTNAPKPRYLLSILVEDETGSQWLSCFDREAEKILGLPASDLAALQQSSPEEYSKVFQQAVPRDLVLGVKAQSRGDPSQAHDLTPRFQVSYLGLLDPIQDVNKIFGFIDAAITHEQAAGAAASSSAASAGGRQQMMQ